MKSLLFWNKTYAAILSSLLALSLATACGGDDKMTKEECEKNDKKEWDAKKSECVNKEAEEEAEDSSKGSETTATTVEFKGGVFTFTPAKAVKDKLADTSKAITVSAQVFKANDSEDGATKDYSLTVKDGVVTFKTFAAKDATFGDTGLGMKLDSAQAKAIKVEFTVAAATGNGIAGDKEAKFYIKGAAVQYLVETVGVESLKDKGFGTSKEADFVKKFDELIKVLAKKKAS